MLLHVDTQDQRHKMDNGSIREPCHQLSLGYVVFIFTDRLGFLTTGMWCFNGIVDFKNCLGKLPSEVMLSPLSPQTIGFLKQLQIRMAEIVLLFHTEVVSEKIKTKF